VPARLSSPVARIVARWGRSEQVVPQRRRDLLACLAVVADPRDRRGQRYRLVSVLAVAVCAVLAGAKSLAAIGEWAADAPPEVLVALGVRPDPLTGRVRPPDEATVRRVLTRVAQLPAARQALRLPYSAGGRLDRAVRARCPRSSRTRRRHRDPDGRRRVDRHHRRGCDRHPDAAQRLGRRHGPRSDDRAGHDHHPRTTPCRPGTRGHPTGPGSQQADLAITDRIHLVRTAEGETADAVRGHERDIAQAVLATTVTEGHHGDMPHAEDSLGFSFSIKRVSSVTS
jgi:hypothetical protein